jgi:hypothetical protein
VYGVTYSVTDGCGNANSVTQSVTVPHDGSPSIASCVAPVSSYALRRLLDSDEAVVLDADAFEVPALGMSARVAGAALAGAVLVSAVAVVALRMRSGRSKQEATV